MTASDNISRTIKLFVICLLLVMSNLTAAADKDDTRADVRAQSEQVLARLYAVDPDARREVLAQTRADYEDPWNAWNAVRTVACTAALACLGWALRLPAEGPEGPRR